MNKLEVLNKKLQILEKSLKKKKGFADALVEEQKEELDVLNPNFTVNPVDNTISKDEQTQTKKNK